MAINSNSNYEQNNKNTGLINNGNGSINNNNKMDGEKDNDEMNDIVNEGMMEGQSSNDLKGQTSEILQQSVVNMDMNANANVNNNDLIVSNANNSTDKAEFGQMLNDANVGSDLVMNDIVDQMDQTPGN